MQLKKIIKNFFTANIEYVDSLSYRRVIMINSMLSLSILVFYFFSYINWFSIQEYTVAILDFVAATTSVGTLYLLRRTKNIKLVAFISVLIIMTFMILFIIQNKNSNFGIIWSVFVPYLAISFNGKRVGLALSTIYLSIMFYLAVDGIGVWNQGLWSEIDFIRFFVALSLFTYIFYLTESAHEDADKELEEVRKKEADMLKSVKTQAITDGLTGMYNRRYFNEIVPKLLGAAQRSETLISLFVLDVDYFKNYNDHYGHHKGDEVLCKIANALINFIQREDDFVFRIGGEEFAGLIHTHNKDESEEWIAKINQLIVNLEIEHKMSKLDMKKVTVSIGVCTAQASQEKDLDYFYKKADEALYVAKNSGRNCIVTFR